MFSVTTLTHCVGYITDTTANGQTRNSTVYENTVFTDTTGGVTELNPYYSTSNDFTSYITNQSSTASNHTENGPNASKTNGLDSQLYNTLDRSSSHTSDIPVTTDAALLEGYNTVKRDSPTATQQSPNIDTENEYAYTTTQVTHPHTVKQSDEYVDPADQLYPPHSAEVLPTDSASNEDLNLYTEPADIKSKKLKKKAGSTKKGTIQVSPSNEYAYANSETKRWPSVEPDHITVGESEDQYAISLKNTIKPTQIPSTNDSPTESLYAVADTLRTKKSPTVGDESEYAIPADAKLPDDGPDEYAIPADAKLPDNGPDEYAITTSPDKPRKKDVSESQESLLKPEHYEAGGDVYAVSVKPKPKPRPRKPALSDRSAVSRNHTAVSELA